MDKNVYIINKEITSVEVDFNLDTKLSNIFLFFQEVSSIQSEVFHIGKQDTLDKDLHWVITRFNVEISRLPKYGEHIKVVTYPGTSNALFFNRHFRILDEKDNVLVKACSVWCVIEDKTHMIKKDPFNGLVLPVSKMEDELPLPGKVEYKEGKLIYKKTIRYSDIDLNSHLNNTRYIELIQDAFDIDFYKSHKLVNLTINYLSELKLNDEVSIYKDEDEEITIRGSKEDKDHFLCSLKFINK